MALEDPVPQTHAVPRRISVLGATGSVGCSTLDLIERDRAAYEIVALSAHANVDALIEQALRLRPEVAVIAREDLYEPLREGLAGTGIEAAAGEAALIEAAGRPADWVMAAIVGAAGLHPTLAAVEQGAHVALANKECLVCAGEFFLQAVARSGARLLPVDSEHNAIFQVLEAEALDRVDKIVLTASGGPFRTASLEEMRRATPAQAVAHPQWDMGAKISVDSATMMNKGLELIEAHHLFPVGEARIDILVHPQSIIHSMVAYADGSVLAQLGTPDMRIPIANTLAWPARMQTPAARLDLAQIGKLTFEAPDLKRFPALTLARNALQSGGAAPTILNAANEVAVAAFLAGKLGFLDIVQLVERLMDDLAGGMAAPDTLEGVMEIDRFVRQKAAERVQKCAV
ncbi:1-deoxy-D-xylulose 5-phosphate reductoisomerase [Tepidicaulis marinus]|uniref:1-deoxy-D-xylulose 5-phosphate reductoisomerase n=1 Tax=Tepidicaulis marinus TaxID=1333998 RepID=A0A081B918_9HYPH|nr:1-deoxy-D-xylulose-5-phosphate reductoisomerase [Tepidicaulis marinus]GAK44536.1 1-deoxy-D-xylulose 5-phosphate reductoisomerase [Tepidicaulis marinus]